MLHLLLRRPFALLSLAAVIALTVFASRLPAQSRSRFEFTATTSHASNSTVYGREIWFALPEINPSDTGVQCSLYITSGATTTAHIVLGGVNQNATVTPFQVTKVSIPLKYEMKTSSVIEKKAIRVWSADADLVCYVMEMSPYSSDGFYAMPNIALGVDNVVASYEALFEQEAFDVPSEFTIVAISDSTSIAITPSADIRGPGSIQDAYHPAGKTFTERLNRGEAVQYQTVQAQATDGYDMTGTVLHSNYPVSVTGASVCPNIPPDFPYCDFVCEEVPPVRSWGRTYYTTNFFQADQGHDASTYLVIGTKAGQVIRRYDAAAGLRTFCILGPQYDHVLDPHISLSSRWESDDPFLLVQYSNSSTFPNGSNGLGDPSEVAIPAVEQFSNSVVFEIPTTSGQTTMYANYVNVVVNDRAQYTTFDGKDIKQFSRLPVDGIHSVYRISNVKPGAHIVASDSGCGVYLYGYGYDEAYSMTAPTHTATLLSPDTIAPTLSVVSSCFGATITASDTGSYHSKLSQMRIDSSLNMTYASRLTWVEGLETDSASYDLHVTDSTLPAYIGITATDLGGNSVAGILTYRPSLGALSSPKLVFGTVDSGMSVTLLDTILNTGDSAFEPTSVRIANGSRGYTLGGFDASPIPAHGTRAVPILLHSATNGPLSDTLVVTSECQKMSAILYANATVPDFTVSSATFPTTSEADTTLSQTVTIRNRSTSTPITINAITIDDTLFKLVTSLPIRLSVGAAADLPVTFSPHGQGGHVAHGHFVSLEAGERIDTLTAIVTAPLAIVGDVQQHPLKIVALEPNPSRGSLTVAYAAEGALRVTAEIFSVLGERVYASEFGDVHSGVSAERITLPPIPRGMYILRLSSGNEVRSQMFQVE